MNKHLTLFGSVAVLLSAFSLTACDSATATNEKKVADVAKPVVAAQQVVEKAVDEPKAVVQAVVAAPKVEEATSEVEEAPAVAAATEEAKPEAAEIPKPEAVAAAEESKPDVAEIPKPEAVATTEAPKTEAEVITEAPKSETVATTEAAKPEAAAAAVETATSKEPKFKEGQHYFEIFPTMQTDTVGGKVEVVELMWLSCPHCFHLEPAIKEYKKSLPGYIDFKQVPAMLNPRWVADARTFHIAQIVDPKGTKKLIDKLFHAIHVQKRSRMAAPDVAKRFILQQGVTEEEFENAANSMVLQAKMNRARQISADSQAQSVPTLIINGRYRTSPYAAGSEKNMIEIVNMLSKKEFEK